MSTSEWVPDMGVITFILFIMGILLPLFHLVNVLFALPSRRYVIRSKENYLRKIPSSVKGISILIPCYNEQGILQTAVMGMRYIQYPDLEVIYVNDGSTDQTMEVLHSLLQLTPCDRGRSSPMPSMPVKGFYRSEKYPHVFVIDKVNGGKADSLNAAIAYATKELVITLDADSVLDKDALNVINRAFQDDDLIAAGGTVNILQGRGRSGDFFRVSLRLKHIVRLQIIEYLKGFYIYRSSLSRLHALSIISGAFGVFKLSVLLDVGGFRQTIGEDIDITLRFQKYIAENKGKRMTFLPEAICYTECPENWRDLFRQRVRWQKAFIDCLIEFRGMLLRSVLTRPVSFFMIVDALLVGTGSTYLALLSFIYVALKPEVINEAYVVYFIALPFMYNLFYNIFGVYVAALYGTSFPKWNKVRVVGTIILDLLFYRFIHMFFVAYGSVSYFFNKSEWSKVGRTGRKYEFEKADIML
jgi:poly-beta-1,6-N-acetyl-D-glucosamine synthase